MGVFNYKLNRDLNTNLPPPPLLIITLLYRGAYRYLSRRHMAKRAADKGICISHPRKKPHPSFFLRPSLGKSHLPPLQINTSSSPSRFLFLSSLINPLSPPLILLPPTTLFCTHIPYHPKIPYFLPHFPSPSRRIPRLPY